ncbi:MAG TPA: hypothetical protein VE175_10715 [Woeseiaceae bacterium]|nr:hypothetical protein [Woeseiaceae bacterium]
MQAINAGCTGRLRAVALPEHFHDLRQSQIFGVQRRPGRGFFFFGSTPVADVAVAPWSALVCGTAAKLVYQRMRDPWRTLLIGSMLLSLFILVLVLLDRVLTLL